MKRNLWMLALLFLALAGCGGGQGARGGRAVITVAWPDRGRLIPVASNSIRATFTQGTFSVSQLLPRPANGTQTTAVFNDLPPGAMTLAASAFPNVDGTGVAQASGSTPVTITADQTANVTLTMASTIDHLEIAPSSPAVAERQTLQLSATAKDAAGAIVLVSSSNLQWSSGAPAHATVNGSGLVTGVLNGTAHITVTESESGKSAGVDVAVQATPIAWWRAENNALDSIGNANGTLRGGVSYAVGVVGQAFLFNGIDGGISIPNMPQLALTGSFTIDGYVKVLSFASQAQGGGQVLFRGDDRGGLDPYYVSVNWDGNIRFHVQDATGAETNLETPIALGRFVRVTMTFNGSSGQMSTYLDGSLAAQTTTQIRPFATLSNADAPGLGIGNVQGPHIYNYPFHGLIDELKVYNEVVPPA